MHAIGGSVTNSHDFTDLQLVARKSRCKKSEKKLILSNTEQWHLHYIHFIPRLERLKVSTKSHMMTWHSVSQSFVRLSLQSIICCIQWPSD